MANVFGDTPHILRGVQHDLRRLFYSEPENALTMQISLPPGYGIVPMGTILGQITEATSPRQGMFAPYTKERPVAGDDSAIGAASLLLDGAADKLVYVTMEDSYKFLVGDHLAIADNTNYASIAAAAKDLGAITDIDRSTYPHKAVITVTNDVSTGYTVARGARVWIQTNATAPFTKAAGILIGGVETGTGEKAQGGMGVIVLSNAMLYKGSLNLYDSEAKTDLGNSEYGQYVILK